MYLQPIRSRVRALILFKPRATLEIFNNSDTTELTVSFRYKTGFNQ